MKITCTYCGKTFIRNSIGSGERHYCSNECKRKQLLKDRSDKGYTKEWLFNEYVIKNKGCPEIAQEIGVNSKTIWCWLKEYDISPRSRGMTESNWFKKGEKPRLGIKHTEATKRKISESSKGRKPYLQNGVHWLKNKGNVNPNWKGGITPERAALYNSLEWSKVVSIIWKRDNATCQKCGIRYRDDPNKNTFHIHHIKGFKHKELRTDTTNLVLLCEDCHRWVHSRKNIHKQFIKE